MNHTHIIGLDSSITPFNRHCIVMQRIHISFETKYVRNEVSTEHMFQTTFTFRIARYSFRTKAIHTLFDTMFVSAQFALKFVNAQCVNVNLAGCAD